VPGDPAATIVAFDPYDPGLLRYIPPEQARPAKVDGPWLDVFLWEGRPYIGTAKEIWLALQPEGDKISSCCPLSFLNLAENVHGVSTRMLACKAFSWMKTRYGIAKAANWRANTYLRGVVIRDLRRELAGFTETGRLRRLLLDVSVREIDGMLALSLPDALLDEFPIAASVAHGRLKKGLPAIRGDGATRVG